MRDNVFQNVPLVKSSFFQKLFKQLPVENSVIELNNLLVFHPILEMSKSQINEIEQRYKVSFKQDFKLNLEEFYAVYLNYCLQDGNLKDEDFDNLNHLRSILSLDDITAKQLHHKVGEIVYKKFFEKAVSNGRLIRREEDFLEKIERDLELPKIMVEKISNDVKISFINNYAQEIITDLEFTPNKEQEINNIAESFRIDLKLDKKIAKQLDCLKFYWKLTNLPLTTIDVDILIQKSEICYFMASSVKWYELKSFGQKTTHYISNFKFVKKFYLNLTAQNSIINQNKKYIDSGNLYVTNKRIIFVGRNKSINVRFEKILKLTPQFDGVEIEKDTIKSGFIQFKSRADEFCLILDKLIKERN